MSLFSRVSFSAGLVAVIVSNLFPLVGLLFWGWRPGDLLVLYWLENLAVGAWSVAKILTARGVEPDGPDAAIQVAFPNQADTIRAGIPILLAGFFCFHFGIFTLVHGTFVFMLANNMGMTSSAGYWFLAWVGLAISHGVSFATNWLPRERARTSPAQAMKQPYSRIFVLHFVVIGGGFLITLGDSHNAGPAYLLLALKTVIDISLYLRSHRPSEVEQPVPFNSELNN